MTSTAQEAVVTRPPQHADEIDLFAPGAQEFWYESYKILHAEQPVVRVPGGGSIPGSDAYIITRYEDINRIVRDPEGFPSAARYNTNAQQEAIFKERGFGGLVTARDTLRPTLETHKQHRHQLTDPWVGASGADRHREMIAGHTNWLIDQFAGRGEVELVKEFAAPLPQRVISTIIGFPLEDMAQLRIWEEAQVRRFVFGRTLRSLMSPEDEKENAEALVQFHSYIQKHITARRAEPREDMITYLTQVNYSGRPLTDGEVMSVIVGMHIGGNETTQYALTSEALLLCQQPGLWEELKADRSKVRFFVEEALRIYAPTQGLSGRLAGSDVVIRGVKIPKGSLLHMRWAAGNRDEEVYPSAHLVDLTRKTPARHLTFSQGPRSCPGAGLSRMEQNIAVNAWLDRFDRFELAPGKNDFKHQPGIMLGMYQLHLNFTLA